MIFRAYARRDGAFVLVPECLVASKDAERRHGPLTLAGHVDSDCFPESAIWQRVLADIDRQSYSIVRSSIAPLMARSSVASTRSAQAA